MTDRKKALTDLLLHKSSVGVDLMAAYLARHDPVPAEYRVLEPTQKPRPSGNRNHRRAKVKAARAQRRKQRKKK